MSLSIIMAVTASCAVYLTIGGKRGPQEDMVDPSAHKERLEPRKSCQSNTMPLHSDAEMSSRTRLEVCLWSSVP
jgi:hypothetical protein